MGGAPGRSPRSRLVRRRQSQLADAGAVAVVTGAASGIGLAISQQLAAAGMQVVLADRDEDGVRTAVARLAVDGRRPQAEVVDVVSGMPDLLRDVAARWGRLDFVFNNAGVGASLAVTQADDDHWARVIDLNLGGVIAGTRAAYAIMRVQGSGHIINTASVSGLVPFPGQTLYNTTKFGVVGLSTTLRPEAARDGVRISVACPGAVATPIWGTPVRGTRTHVPPPRRAISPERAAIEILAGVARNDAIIVVSREARAWVAAYRIAPRATAWLLARQTTRAEPKRVD